MKKLAAIFLSLLFAVVLLGGCAFGGIVFYSNSLASRIDSLATQHDSLASSIDDLRTTVTFEKAQPVCAPATVSQMTDRVDADFDSIGSEAGDGEKGRNLRKAVQDEQSMFHNMLNVWRASCAGEDQASYITKLNAIMRQGHSEGKILAPELNDRLDDLRDQYCDALGKRNRMKLLLGDQAESDDTCGDPDVSKEDRELDKQIDRLTAQEQIFNSTKKDLSDVLADWSNLGFNCDSVRVRSALQDRMNNDLDVLANEAGSSELGVDLSKAARDLKVTYNGIRSEIIARCAGEDQGPYMKKVKLLLSQGDAQGAILSEALRKRQGEILDEYCAGIVKRKPNSADSEQCASTRSP